MLIHKGSGGGAYRLIKVCCTCTISVSEFDLPSGLYVGYSPGGALGIELVNSGMLQGDIVNRYSHQQNFKVAGPSTSKYLNINILDSKALCYMIITIVTTVNQIFLSACMTLRSALDKLLVVSSVIILHAALSVKLGTAH